MSITFNENVIAVVIYFTNLYRRYFILLYVLKYKQTITTLEVYHPKYKQINLYFLV